MAKGYKETLLTKAPSLFLGQKKTDISVVTGRKPHRKRSKKETDKLGEQEVELEKALTPRFIHSQVPRDKLSLYREGLASNLRKLLRIKRIQAKNEINSAIFKYLLVWEESITRRTSELSTKVPRTLPTTSQMMRYLLTYSQ